MTQYMILFPADDEARWRSATEAEHQLTYDTDAEFLEALTSSGGTIVGGAALTDSAQARTLRVQSGSGSDVMVTDGPYAETVEQLSGFYLVTCEDYDVLADLARVLTRAHPVVEIRPVEDF